MARRFAGRRKPRVLWMPTFGLQVPVAADGPTRPPGIEASITLSDDAVVYDAFPLTFDYSTDAGQFQSNTPDLEKTRTLNDLIAGNAWRLRRIVGKAFISATSDELDDPLQPSHLVDCALGFIVCNTDDDGSPRTNFDEVNPLCSSSMEDPWIWRRRWLLNPYGNTRAIDVANNGNFNPAFQLYPGTTAGYGSVADGPHIDQKTARTIHRSERLFGVFAARVYNWFGALTVADTQVHMLLDYRLLGNLKPTAAGNRGNAAR